MKKLSVLIFLFILFSNVSHSQKLEINGLDYFESAGINVFVFSNQYNGMFFDEKTAGIELIHHGVRTATGSAIRLQNTPEQCNPVPLTTIRTPQLEIGMTAARILIDNIESSNSREDERVEISSEFIVGGTSKILN